MINGLYDRGIREVESGIKKGEKSVCIVSRSGDNCNEARLTIDAVRNEMRKHTIKIAYRSTPQKNADQEEEGLLDRVEKEIDSGDDDIVLSIRLGDRIRTLRNGRLLEYFINKAAEKADVNLSLDQPIVSMPLPSHGASIDEQIMYWASRREGVVPASFLEATLVAHPSQGLGSEFTVAPQNEEQPPSFVNGSSLQPYDLILVSYWQELLTRPLLVKASLSWVGEGFPMPQQNGSYDNGACIALAKVYPAERFDFHWNVNPKPETILWQSPRYLNSINSKYTHMNVHRVK